MKKIMSLALLVAMMGAVVATPISAADETTDATVTFKVEDTTTPTTPVDPIDPDETGTEPGTGMEGPLSLDYVPNLDFGVNDITGSVETIDSLTLQPYVQVTDKRGEGTGWAVKATLGNLTDTASKTLNAKINFKNASVKTTTGNTSNAPTAGDFTLTAGTTTPQNVVVAADDEGMGTWVAGWLSSGATNANVQMVVDTATARTTSVYTGTLTWTIQLAP